MQYCRSDRPSFWFVFKFISTSVHARLQISTYSVMICVVRSPGKHTYTHA